MILRNTGVTCPPPPRETVRRKIWWWIGHDLGCIQCEGKSEIAVLTGKQASEHYLYILSEFLLPIAQLHYGADYIFQQDNASIHKSELTAKFFEEQQLKVMKKWPARSPQLNPIENLCSILAVKVYS